MHHPKPNRSGCTKYSYPLIDLLIEHRVSLQKYWVSQPFTNDYQVVQRYSAECELDRPNEISGCDLYVVEDKVAKKEFTFYIYLGNWPHLHE